MKELSDIPQTIHTIDDIIRGFLCQPRFNNGGEVGDVLESIAEFLRSYEQAAVNMAIAAKPSTADDAEWRGWTILGFEADCADDLVSFGRGSSRRSRS